MGTDWNALAEIASSRARIYGLLTAVFRDAPNKALIKDLRGPLLKGALSELGVELGESFYEKPEKELIDELTVEFTQLFFGPGPHISPHESIFIDVDGNSGGLWGPKTVEVKKFIETTGLEYATGFTGLPDHISVEFEFMQRLALWEAEKWEGLDRQGAEYCLNVQRRFLEQHLFNWLQSFSDAVITKAKLPFYRSMAGLAKNYMTFEQERVLTETAA